MKPTIKTIAKAAGVSAATVSKALNDMPDISDATKARIRQICAEMGYTRNANARNLISGRTHTIGLLITRNAMPPNDDMIQAIITRMMRHDYSVFLRDSEGDPQKEQQAAIRMLENRVDALIVQPVSSSFTQISALVDGTIPIICIGHANRLASATVVVDEYEGGVSAARYLLRQGHRRCAVLLSDMQEHSHRRRAEGFESYMRAHGGHTMKLYTKEKGEAAGIRLARELLQSGRQVTAAFATDDLLAVGVMYTLQNRGVSVPGDLSIVGYGDAPFSAIHMVSLTTMRLPSLEMGLCASDAAVDAIAGKEDVLKHFSLVPTLVERGSVRAV